MLNLKWLTLAFLTAWLLIACRANLPGETASPNVTTSSSAVAASVISADLFQQSWQAYRHRFVQGDGRVIDREASDRSTSEGQAYALLRAVWMDDRDTFDRVLQWSETNLQRRDANGNRTDLLWAWKWGQQPNGNWGPIDQNFASDGDVDAITALIWAAKQWRHSPYLDLARQKLVDLWALSTVSSRTNPALHYLLPGPKVAFQPEPDWVYLNPSYLAPYAFRLFAEIDRDRDWQSLVDSSYQVLEAGSQLSAVGLPSDWLVLDLVTGNVKPTTTDALKSRYGFDAYRVWWRVALDVAWFNEPRAEQYLQRQLQPFRQRWQAQQKIPAQFDLQGNPLVDYDSTAQYAMLYAAFRLIEPDIAMAIYQQRLVPVYRDGFWDNDSAYYVQNLSWLGLFPVDQLPDDWFTAAQ